MTNNNEDFLTQYNDANDTLSDVISNLNYIAKALRVCGNEKLSDDIYEIANSVDTAKTLHKESHNNLFNRYIGSVNQGTGNMISAVIAMSKLKEPTP